MHLKSIDWPELDTAGISAAGEQSRPADYASFLASKRLHAPETGFSVPADAINPRLFPWQRDVVRWALRRGRAALFEDCGLGKTLQQLEWASQICQYTGGKVLILDPVAVGPQTKREADRFEIAAPVECVGYSLDVKDGISVTNYERLHHFRPQDFVGVVLDESSILKSFTGKIKQKLVSAFRDTPYKLSCTATPAPNDLLELGNQAEFLGIMPSNEMIARWFINDSMHAGKYRLMKHAAADFWRWVSSWAVCLSKPSDLGHSDEGYTLPELVIHEHRIENLEAPPGHLFHPGKSVSAMGVHTEKRAGLAAKADLVAGLVNDSREQWVVWCDTDYEADALRRRIPDAVEVRASTPRRDDKFLRFETGEIRVLITKPKIGGFGLNWQHCHNMTWFANYSYEQFYQAVRRFLRFGQRHAVNVHLIASDGEQSVVDAADVKRQQHEEMKSEMAAAMRDFQIENLYGRRKLREYRPAMRMEMPRWLQGKF